MPVTYDLDTVAEELARRGFSSFDRRDDRLLFRHGATELVIIIRQTSERTIAEVRDTTEGAEPYLRDVEFGDLLYLLDRGTQGRSG